MTELSISRSPPDNWDAYCKSNAALFHGHAWQELLESAFRCETRYGMSVNADYGMAISTFFAGPFKIGYLGFPVGGLVGNRILNPEIIDEWKATGTPLNCHCLRVPVSAFEEAEDLPLTYVANPETAICNLQDWHINQVSKKLRRDIRKAQRTSLTITDAGNSIKGSDLYSIYESTVKRNNGLLRYNERYFSAVINMSNSCPELRCLLAWSDGRLAGFIVIARHKRTTYYLHGGTELSLRHLSPSDLLLHEAILWAQTHGSDCFNLMTSSSDQHTLVRYKEKWGAVTRQHKTYTLKLRPAFCTSFNLAQWAYNMMRKINAA